MFPIMLRQSSWDKYQVGKEKVTEILAKKIKISKIWGGEEYQVEWNLIYIALHDNCITRILLT